MRATHIIAAIVFAIGMAGAAGARGQDRHASYYYPEPATTETFESLAEPLPQASRPLRIGFVTAMTNQNANRPYPPQTAVFAKGDRAEKLIIVALVDGRFDTLFRARAELANLTAAARLLPAFQEMGVQDQFTFFDLVKMLGFEQITVSNGRDFAHQVFIK
ncbi:MAG TPA: molybdopterin-guanine dinucleotide biosynthesis protein A [Kiloniellales bacterium]|jgi:hypothetical protein